MRLIHIRLDLEYKRAEALFEGIYKLLTRNSRQGRGRHLKEMLKERLNAEIVERRAEEYGRKLSVAHSLEVEVKASSVKKLDLLAKLCAKSLSDKRIKLFGICYIAVYAVYLLSSAVRIAEG